MGTPGDGSPTDRSAPGRDSAATDRGPGRFDRRRFLGLLGTAGTAATAGCRWPSDGPGRFPPGGGESTGRTATADGTAPAHPDVRHVGFTPTNPDRLAFNLLCTDCETPAIAHHLLFEPFATYSFATDEWLPAGIADWRVADDRVELTVREGLAWSDGTPVTAEDVTLQFRLAEHVDDPLWEWATAVEAVDERRVAIRTSEPRNPALVEDELLDRFLFADRGTYGPILESLETGSDPTALTGFADPEPVTNGPFELVERDLQRLVASRNPAHPDADAIDFGEYALETTSAEFSALQGIVSLDFDSCYRLTVPAEVRDELPEAVASVRTPAVFGLGLTPNHADPIAGDRAVRRAIAYLVDREAAVPSEFGPTRRAPEIPTALSTAARAQWLGDAATDFETYGVDASMTEAAAAVLEDAGYERSGGRWRTPDGDPLSITVTQPPGWSDWLGALETAAGDLTEFGVDVALETADDYSRARTSGDFQFLAHTWLPESATPRPYHSLRHQLVAHERFPARYEYPPAAATEATGGRAAAVTVPARDGPGSLTVTPTERVDDLARATDPERRRAIVRELAWVANRDLPQIPLVEQFDEQWLTTDEWTVPDDLASDPDATVRWAATWLPRTGKLGSDGG